MNTLNQITATLAMTMGLAWDSGINLYATLLILGFLANTGNIDLPPDLQVVANPAVMMAAGLMYFVEFFPARHYFSRKLKWGPIRFQQRKMTWRVCLRRPAFVPLQPKTQNIGFRLALYFDLARMT